MLNGCFYPLHNPLAESLRMVTKKCDIKVETVKMQPMIQTCLLNISIGEILDGLKTKKRKQSKKIS